MAKINKFFASEISEDQKASIFARLFNEIPYPESIIQTAVKFIAIQCYLFDVPHKEKSLALLRSLNTDSHSAESIETALKDASCPYLNAGLKVLQQAIRERTKPPLQEISSAISRVILDSGVKPVVGGLK